MNCLSLQAVVLTAPKGSIWSVRTFPRCARFSLRHQRGENRTHWYSVWLHAIWRSIGNANQYKRCVICVCKSWMYYVVTEYPSKDIVVGVSNCKGIFGFVFVFVKAYMYHSISTYSGQYLYSYISVFITFLSRIPFF